MIRSSMGPARSQRRLVWLAVTCESSTRSKSGCRQTVFGWMLIRPSSFGLAQVTSLEISTCRRSIQSCRLPMLWTISESTLTQNWLWSVRLANFAKFAIFTCIVYARCVNRWFMPSSQVKLITATAFFTDLIRIFSSASVHAEFGRSLGSEHSKVQRNLGCIEFKIVLLVWHCLVGLAPEYLMQLCHPVSSAAGRQKATSSFLVSDSEHLVSELLLSWALSFGTCFHWTLDNLVTI